MEKFAIEDASCSQSTW